MLLHVSAGEALLPASDAASGGSAEHIALGACKRHPGRCLAHHRAAEQAAAPCQHWQRHGSSLGSPASLRGSVWASSVLAGLLPVVPGVDGTSHQEVCALASPLAGAGQLTEGASAVHRTLLLAALPGGSCCHAWEAAAAHTQAAHTWAPHSQPAWH